MVSEWWLDLLEQAIQTDAVQNWLAYFHLGIMRHYAGDLVGSRGAFEQCLGREWTPWAARNLAILAWDGWVLR